MRRDNRSLARFRAHHEQLAELLVHHCPASVTDVNIQAGEDPLAVREVVIPLIQTLRRETRLGVSVCLGSMDTRLYSDLKVSVAYEFLKGWSVYGTAGYVRDAFHVDGGLFIHRL